jgi:hypothetical protein
MITRPLHSSPFSTCFTFLFSLLTNAIHCLPVSLYLTLSVFHSHSQRFSPPLQRLSHSQRYLTPLVHCIGFRSEVPSQCRISHFLPIQKFDYVLIQFVAALNSAYWRLWLWCQNILGWNTSNQTNHKICFIICWLLCYHNGTVKAKLLLNMMKRARVYICLSVVYLRRCQQLYSVQWLDD